MDFYIFQLKRCLRKKFLEKDFLLWQEMQEKGYIDDAVDVLGKAGYDVWINSAGDIAVRPPVDALT